MRPRRSNPGSKSQAPKLYAPPVELTSRLMRKWPLPEPAREGDKEERGRVLVVGGAAEMPGAVMLAATAALRAGAGKLRIATCRSIAQLVGALVPESRVFALPETKSGAIAARAVGELAEQIKSVQAVLIGPGLVEKRAVARLMISLLPRIRDTVVIIDALALGCLKDAPGCLARLGGKAIITPHAGEMGELIGKSKDEVAADQLATAREMADQYQAVVALKGAQTFIAAPGGKVYRNNTGNVGLATSGSGDTLSGIIAGLAARGADPLQAAAWAVYLHGRAGDRLAKRMGGLGFLARELLTEIPPLMSEFDK